MRNEKQLFRWADFIIPSTLKLSAHIHLIQGKVECKQKREFIELGLHEALVNAVRHGNLGDPKKKLRVRRIITPNWVVWQIQDQGLGIPSYERIFSLPSEIDAESGRGLFLIHECFDDVRWSRKGNRLQIASKRTDQPNAMGILDL
ncbi:ATP-binding protein [Prochlorococcus marinus]|uniref:ATP-binding protein n=1 Tax=Prochlorococcus marinus TaxID=1219 RepID=UPI0022B5999F|nr:ATP-binding protein [Prochlorococcus marinus]